MGAGAATCAFTGMSAAMAEPVNAATAVIAIASFFMEIPLFMSCHTDRPPHGLQCLRVHRRVIDGQFLNHSVKSIAHLRRLGCCRFSTSTQQSPRRDVHRLTLERSQFAIKKSQYCRRINSLADQATSYRCAPATARL